MRNFSSQSRHLHDKLHPIPPISGAASGPANGLITQSGNNLVTQSGNFLIKQQP